MRGRRLFLLTAVVFLAYCFWMIGPYVRSTLVRDSAVTTWSRSAVAPIDGRITTDLPAAGSQIGTAGLVATIENPLLFTEKQTVEEMREQVAAAEINLREANEQLRELAELEQERIAGRDQLAAVFRRALETEIANLRLEAAVTRERIEVLQRIVQRSRDLVGRGVGANAELDEANLRLSEARLRETTLQSELAFALLRDEAAGRGVFIAEDGSTPDWLRYGELELNLQQQRMLHERDRARARLEDSRRGLELARTMLADLTSAPVTAPPGALVFSVLAAPDAVVAAGQPIIEWINCDILLVDVPVPDAQIPLIETGDRAEVVMEGESFTREATVLLTRGAAATIGRRDLAALAKGRADGEAQALLTLQSDGAELDRCPIGQAAYVRFPGIGLLDILQARLRL